MKDRARVITTDEQIDAAIARAAERERFRPRAVAVKYFARQDAVVITFASGVELAVPRSLLQGLEKATPPQAARVELLAPGTTLHWEALDVDHYVPRLIEGVFGNSRWMSELGKRGGAATSEAKAKASRSNGRKGGRPPKPQPSAARK